MYTSRRGGIGVGDREQAATACVVMPGMVLLPAEMRCLRHLAMLSRCLCHPVTASLSLSYWYWYESSSLCYSVLLHSVALSLFLSSLLLSDSFHVFPSVSPAACLTWHLAIVVGRGRFSERRWRMPTLSCCKLCFPWCSGRCCLRFAQLMKRIQKLKGGPKGKIARAEKVSVEGRGMVKYL